MSDIEVVVDMPAEYSGMVFGQFDEYAKEIERNLKVDLISRDGVVKIIGEKTAADNIPSAPLGPIPLTLSSSLNTSSSSFVRKPNICMASSLT